MSTTVSYKGQTLATVSNQTKTLLTEGKYLEDDLTLTDVSGGGAVLGTKNITANGTYEAEDDSLDGYSEVTVAVPASAVDSGTKNITANGNEQDVVGYAEVNVNVPNTYSAGDEGKVVSNGALVAQTAHADVTPTTSDQTIDTTTNNSIKVKGDADLVAGNIKKDVEIFGVTGSYEGGGGGYTLAEIATGTEPSGVIDISGLTVAKGAFAYNPSITRVIGDNVKLGESAFRETTGITSCNIRGITQWGKETFYSGTGIVQAVLQASVEGSTSVFQYATNLEIVDLDIPKLRTNYFYNDHKLATIILRKTSIVALENTGVLNQPNHFKSGGTGGTIYIPKSLYDHLGDGGSSDYKAASNWSTVDGYGTITWAKIEGSYYETHYADGTVIS